ncbi:MAG: hypothetical protein E3J81_08995 [Dehalococcoidia bacterium]|nr:MAG: hypothetical protein E3J81_08995 [Dehalococcoidia bacterium]
MKRDAYSERVISDEDLKAYIQRAKDYNRPRILLHEKAYKFRMMEQDVAVPPGAKKTAIELKNAFVWDMCLRTSASITKNSPRCEAVPAGITIEDEKGASKKERHTKGALNRMTQEAGLQQQPFPRASFSQVSLGMGVYEMLWRPDRWSHFPKRKREDDARAFLRRAEQHKRSARFPFSWRSLDPMTYHPLYGDEGTEFAVIETERPIGDLARVFQEDKVRPLLEGIREGEAGWESRKTLFQTVWTNTHVYYRIGGKTVDQFEHGYGRIPLFEVRGVTTESNIPGKDSLPITFGLLKYAPLIDTMFTTLINALLVSGIPTPFLTPDTQNPAAAVLFGPDGRMIKSYPIVLGDVNIAPGQIDLPLSKAVPQILTESINAIMGVAESTMLPKVLRGEGVGSDWSGYLAQTVLHIVLTLLGPIVDNHEQALTEMTKFYWELIESKAKTDVWVWAAQRPRGGKWAPLGPKDIEGFYECRFHIRPSLPRDEHLRAQTGMQLWQAGAIDLRTLLTVWLDEEFPDEIEERIMLERLFKRPEVDDILLQQIIQRLAGESPVIQAVGEQMGMLGATPPGMPQGPPELQQGLPGAFGAGMPPGPLGGGGAVPFAGGRPPGMPTPVPGGPRMIP